MKIHVVSFQVPYPADYGGAIDVYYKLQALHESGYSIVLHTYVYGDRKQEKALDELCDEVHYYPRQTGWKKQFSRLPYIVASRCDKQLLTNLLKDDAPILFEGLHTCYLLSHPALAKCRKIVRMHNIEHTYYLALAHQAGFSWKSLFFWIESLRLKRFERTIEHAQLICAITESDRDELQQRYPRCQVVHLPCFFDTAPLEAPLHHQPTQPFVLYHGNLSVAENWQVVRYIVNTLAPRCQDLHFVIAGRNPRPLHTPHNVEIVANPSDEQLMQLIGTARVHLMLTFQRTGIKLKLLNALTYGHGHVVANADMLHGHSLGQFCQQADSTTDIVEALHTCMKEEMSGEMLARRREALIKTKKAGISRLSLF